MKTKILLIIFIVLSSTSFAQSVHVGIELESLGYSNRNIIKNISEEYITLIPLSGYLKGSITFYDKYEIELKYGAQLGEIFAGLEYALELKYNALWNLFPMISYMKHFNAGDSRTGSGIYNSRIEFLGLGIEAKITKLFGIDLLYYKAIGGKGLEYSIYSGPSSNKVTTSEMESMIKLGFIFNIKL